jgi:glycolate oxidase
MSKNHAYAAVTPAIVEELRRIVGAKSVLVDEEKIEAYSHDETNAEEYGHMPEVVVLPAATAEVAAVVKLAVRERIPITPRGAGSGLSAAPSRSSAASCCRSRR